MRPALLLGDLRGGVIAAAVVLPQATAFGAAVFAPALGSAGGALAGLYGAIGLLLISGIAGGTIGLISGPTGPSMALLSGSAALLIAQGMPPATLAPALFLVTVLAGLLQLLIALAGGGRLIKFIPYPVIAGLTTGIGLLLIHAQFKPLLGLPAAGVLSDWHGLPLATATTAFLLTRYAPRWIPGLPGPIAGLLGASALFQIARIPLHPDAVPQHWTVGALPEPAALHLALDPHLLTQTLPWPLLLQASFALAILSSLNTLLTAVIADSVTGQRHRARRELLAQGIGQIVVGLLGGMAGGASLSGTTTAVRAGARRWAPLLAAGLLLFLLLGAGAIGRWLPTSALAGLIIASALALIETDILAWARRRHTRRDAAVALLVATVSVGHDLMLAVLVGLAIAVALFIHDQSRVPVIHRRLTGAERPSVRKRPLEQAALLAAHGERIVLYQLRGNLFFAKTDALFEELLVDLDRPAWVILHLRRVLQVDLSSVRLLQQIAARLEAHGGELLFCDVDAALGLGHEVEQTLRRLSLRPGRLHVHTFAAADQALEYAENALLRTLGMDPARLEQPVTLEELDLCRAMPAQAVQILAAVLQPRSLAAGERLFAAGDNGAELYLVLAGRVDIRLPAGDDRYKRLAIYGPGTSFGEIAFLDPGPRAAEAVAAAPSMLLMLTRSAFDRLRAQQPEAAIALLLALGQLQSRALRWSAREIQRLIEW